MPVWKRCCASNQNSPEGIEDAREATRQRHSHNMIPTPPRDLIGPVSEVCGLRLLLTSQDAPGSFDQQPTDPGVARFGDRSFSLCFTGTPFPRHKPEIALELMRIPKSCDAIHSGNEGDGRDRAHSWRRHQSSRALILLCAKGDLSIQLVDVPVERCQQR